MSKNETASGAAITEVELCYAGWTRLYRTKVRWPDGREAERDIEDHGSGVAVLAFDPGRRMAVLVRQFRPPAAFAGEAADLLEAIAGIVESGSPEECARREAMEEAGLRLGVLEPVAGAWMMPGISTERVHFFLAEYSAADRVTAGGGLLAEGEHILVEEMPLSELAGHLANGSGPVDVKLLVLSQALQLRRPELFIRADR